MKIPIEVTNFISETAPLIKRMTEIINPMLSRLSERYDGFFQYRIKSGESITEKLYKGEIKDAFLFLDDFFAGTIVLPSRHSIMLVINDLERMFELKEKISKRVNQPTKFEYDDVHLILSIKPEKYESAGPIHRMKFEIQIKTLMQYAISKATHDILYKGDKQTSRQIRFAAQLRAMLEMAESLMGNIDIADQLVDFSENQNIETRGKIIDFVKTNWLQIDQPKDLRRTAITIENYLNLAGISFDTFLSHLDTYRQILELRSVGPIPSTLAILLDIKKQDFLQKAKRNSVFFLVPSETEELLPILKDIPAEMRVKLDCDF